MTFSSLTFFSSVPPILLSFLSSPAVHHRSSSSPHHRKQALKHHPDRNAGSNEATTRFQALGNAYDRIINPPKEPAFPSSFGGGGGGGGFPGFGGMGGMGGGFAFHTPAGTFFFGGGGGGGGFGGGGRAPYGYYDGSDEEDDYEDEEYSDEEYGAFLSILFFCKTSH